MNYKKTEGFFDSSNGFDKIAYYTYVPDCQPKAVLQLCHGMCEYIARYEHFIDYLCGQGYAVIGHDHLGHGNSVSDNGDLGYFALEHGWICLIKDLRKCQLIADDIFGDVESPEKRNELLDKCCEYEHLLLNENEKDITYPGMRECMEKLSESYQLYIVSNCQCGYIELVMKKNEIAKCLCD